MIAQPSPASWPLASCLTGTFQGHAAHAAERPPTLRPNGSVGRDRARYVATRFSIPPVVTVHATFTAHGRRLPGISPRFLSGDIERDSPPSHSPGSYFEAPDKLWPFAMDAAFPRADYYGHADSTHGHRRISRLFPAHYFRSP